MIKIRNYPIKVITFLLLLILHILSFGQITDMQFTDPINDKDFNNKNCTSIAQDSIGFIWIGTNDGLYCFNGIDLVCYKSDRLDSTSINDNNIRKLFTDNSGKLWIATEFGLCTYNQCFDNFEQITVGLELANGDFVRISAINQDHNNNIYIAAYNTIYRFNTERNIFDPFFLNDSIFISDFLFDENDNLWISTLENGGLILYNPSENITKRFLFDENDSNSLSFNSIRDIVYEGNSKLWIGTYGGGLNLLDTETGVFKKYKSDNSYSNYIVFTYLDKQNNLWICDLNGLSLYDRASDSLNEFKNSEIESEDIKKYPLEIFQDKQGNYWTFHEPGGVGLRFIPKGIKTFDKNHLNFWHTINNNISIIEFDTNGVCWIGNGNDGIDVFDWNNQLHKSYLSNLNDSYSLGQGAVCAIFNDSKNRMWIGTNIGGLQYYDEDKDRFITYMNDPQNPNSISNNDIRGIVEDKKENFWIVTHGKGIDYFNTKEQKFNNYNNANNSLSNDWAFQVLIDSDEYLWVATSKGISKLKKGDKNFKSYYSNPEDTNSISHNYINCLFEDSKKQIWIGTFEGLCKYNPESDNFVRYMLDFGSQNICAIEEDEKGNLWISTLNGISEFNPETGKVICRFDETDGLPDGIFNYRASSKNNGNEMFFGSRSGISYFNPEKLVFNNQIPDVFITGFNLFNHKIIQFGEEEVLENNIICLSEIELKHNQNSIGFEFASTNYIDIKNNKFKYKLEGIDNDWIETTEAKATYNYLPPGNYIFRVITANNDNIWNNTGASINIIIHKPWWFSWWFLSIVISVFLLLVLLIFRFRMAALKAEKFELEKQVQIRTKNLFEKNILLKEQTNEINENYLLLKKQKYQIEQQSDKLKEIADNLTEINKELTLSNTTKDKLFSIVAHDLINPFNTILGFTSMLIENFDSWNESKKIKFLNYINDSSNSAFSLLQNLLQWARSQKGEIEFRPENLKVSSEFDIVLNEVSYLAIKKEIQIVNLLKDEKLIVFFDSDIIKLILRNLLMNAIKFSNYESSIFIDAKEVEDNSILFSVRDQGVGMNAEYASSIFNSGEDLKILIGTSGEKGIGLGLVLCKEFITNQKGNIWVESSPGEGSTFFFTIPKNYNSRNPD